MRTPTFLRRRSGLPSPPDAADDVAVYETMQRIRAVIPPRLRDQFTVRYVAALTLIALLSISAGLVITHLIDAQAAAAAEINVAGRQRMLSQRIALQAGLLPQSRGGDREALRVRLAADVEAMATAQRGLLDGDQGRHLPGRPSPAVLALYRSGTETAVDDFVDSAREVLATPRLTEDTAAIRSLQAQALGPLLTSLDQVVSAYQQDSELRVSSILEQERLLLGLTLIALLGEALLVFRPMSRRIEREKRRLEEASQRHRAEAALHEFGLQLRDAIDLADTEIDVAATVMQAVERAGVPGLPELLLVQTDQSLTATQAGNPHACSVGSAGGCPALRRGRSMTFTDSSALGACAPLRHSTESRESVASTCVPLTFLGTGIGVLRTVTPAGVPTLDRSQGSLETIAGAAGTHIGTLRASSQSRDDAERDPMTGLYNRRGLQKEVSRLVAQGVAFAVVAIDLDRFKDVNDTFGHDVGDMVLIEAAQAMATVLRPGDLLARHGGDEFVVVVQLDHVTHSAAQTDPEEWGHGVSAAMAVAERIRAALEATTGRPDRPGCPGSIGVAGPVTDDLEGALRRADTALYRAKERGRNRVELADSLLEAMIHESTTKGSAASGSGL